MSPRTVAVLVAALIGLFAGVYALSRDVADTSRNTSRTLARQSAAGCARAVADRTGLQALNDDLAVFAAGAAKKRRAEGNIETARTYEAVVLRARARAIEIAQRLPPALDCATAFRAP